MVRRLFLSLLVASLALSYETAQARDLMYVRPVGGGPTYKEIVEAFFATHVFPSELKYNGVGISRDNVIAERIESNDRGGYYLTVRARYSGSVYFVNVAERAKVHYDNGGIRVDLGGMKGALSTRGISRWVSDKFNGSSGSGGGGSGGGSTGSGGGTGSSTGVTTTGPLALYDVSWITNNSRALATIYFQTSSGAWKKKVLQRGETTHFYKTRDGIGATPTLVVRLDADTDGVHVVEYRMSRGPSPDYNDRSYGHHFELKQLTNSDKRYLTPLTSGARLELLDARSVWPTDVIR